MWAIVAVAETGDRSILVRVCPHPRSILVRDCPHPLPPPTLPRARARACAPDVGRKMLSPRCVQAPRARLRGYVRKENEEDAQTYLNRLREKVSVQGCDGWVTTWLQVKTALEVWLRCVSRRCRLSSRHSTDVRAGARRPRRPSAPRSAPPRPSRPGLHCTLCHACLPAVHLLSP